MVISLLDDSCTTDVGAHEPSFGSGVSLSVHLSSVKESSDSVVKKLDHLDVKSLVCFVITALLVSGISIL